MGRHAAHDRRHGLNRDRVHADARPRLERLDDQRQHQDGRTGMLSNEVYRGEIVWNKVGKAKNPATGKRVPRINPKSEWRHVQAPQLRIVEDTLFAAVQAERVRRTHGSVVQQRGPQRLLSGLLKCSACGSSIVACGSKKSRRVGMCTRARESGSCDNRRVVYLDLIEEKVIEGLAEQLAHPDVIAEAVREYHAEMRRLEGDRASSRSSDMRKLGELRRSVERMIDALAAGDVTGASVGRRIAEAEATIATLEKKLEETAPPDVIALHPKALDYYLAALKTLSQTLNARQDQAAAGPIRELIASIVVFPREPREPVRFEIQGRLAALLNKEVGLMVPRVGISRTHHLAPEPLFVIRGAA
jgi:site-specific DNA recombinase